MLFDDTDKILQTFPFQADNRVDQGVKRAEEWIFFLNLRQLLIVQLNLANDEVLAVLQIELRWSVRRPIISPSLDLRSAILLHF